MAEYAIAIPPCGLPRVANRLWTHKCNPHDMRDDRRGGRRPGYRFADPGLRLLIEQRRRRRHRSRRGARSAATSRVLRLRKNTKALRAELKRSVRRQRSGIVGVQ